MMENYDDIINLPHHISKRHPQMSIQDRAAQFAPFAVLTGYDEEVSETARITEEFHPVLGREKEEIDQKLLIYNKINIAINNINTIFLYQITEKNWTL